MHHNSATTEAIGHNKLVQVVSTIRKTIYSLVPVGAMRTINTNNLGILHENISLCLTTKNYVARLIEPAVQHSYVTKAIHPLHDTRKVLCNVKYMITHFPKCLHDDA